jgi:hypothetical protein
MKTKTAWWFWLIAVLATLWNSGGVFDFLMTHTHNEAYMSAFTESQRQYFYSYPIWASAVWAIAVFGAFSASLLLFLRTKFAFYVFVASLIGMVGSFGYQLVSDVPDDLYNSGNIAFTIVIWVVAILLTWYARSMTLRGVLK